MATIIKTLDTDYIVNSSDQFVTLEVIIGSVGQTGQTVLTIDDKSPQSVTIGDLPDSFVGGLLPSRIDKNKNLDGKILKVKTSIVDTSRDTNNTELIVRVRGGKFGFKEYTLLSVVRVEGDDAYYEVTINFINA